MRAILDVILLALDLYTWIIIASAVLSWLMGGSFGQLICRIAVIRTDRKSLGPARAVLRAALVSLAIPPLIISADRRGLQDLTAGTAVVNRRDPRPS